MIGSSHMSGYWALLRSFPRLVIGMLLILVVDVVVTTVSIASVAPIADLLLDKPKSEWLGVTKLFESWLSGFDIEFTLLSSAMVVWLSLTAVSIISIVVVWYSTKIRFAVERRLIQESYEKLYASRWEYFLTVKKSDLANSFVVQSSRVGAAFFNIGQLSASIVRLIAIILAPLLIAPLIVLYCVGGLAILIIPFLVLSKYSYFLGQKAVSFSNRFMSVTREALEGAREILAFSAGKQTLRQMMRAFDKLRANDLKVRVTNAAITSLYEPVAFLVIILVIMYGTEGVKDLSKLSVILWGFMKAIPQIKGSISLFHQLSNTLPGLEQIRAQQAIADEWHHDNGSQEYQGFSERIKLENISYCYPDGHAAIENISIEIPKGKVVCFVGNSGSGKTTTVDCAIGLIKPSDGRIYYDNIEISELRVQSIRSKMSVVSQKPMLFDASVKDNLLWASATATEELLWEVCEIAGAIEFIKSFENGIDTMLGESGVRLSGGQVQRLAIARALVRRPEVLVLDEASNALDSINEVALFNRMFVAYPNMTVIMIAHNMVTAAKADLIYVMRDGQITAQGDYDTLLRTDHYFKQLVGSQHINSAS